MNMVIHAVGACVWNRYMNVWAWHRRYTCKMEEVLVRGRLLFDPQLQGVKESHF